MPLLPDLTVAGGIALAVFLLTLGVLVIFLESVPRRIVFGLLLITIVLVAVLSLVDELGIGIILLAFAAAFLANDVFEWLTTR